MGLLVGPSHARYQVQGSIDHYLVRLGEYISCAQSLTDLTSILHKFGRLLVNEALKESFKNWRTSAEGQKLESKETYELHDHDYIMKIMISHSGDLNWIQSK